MRGGGHQKSRLGLPALLLAGTAWASAAAAQQAVEDDAVPGLSAGDDSYLSSLYRQRSDQPGDAGLLTAPGRKSYVYEAVLSPRLTWSDNVTLASDGEGEGDALAAVYHDAGVGKDQAGISRLPALDQRGIAAVTLDCNTCAIGNAASALATGVISAVNRSAAALGLSEGTRLAEAIGHVLRMEEQPS